MTKEFYHLADIVTEIFVTSFTSNGATVTYDALDTNKQTAIRIDFFKRLRKENIKLSNEFCFYFQEQNSGSALVKMFNAYRANSNVADMHTMATMLNRLADEKITLLYSDDFGYPCVTHTRVLDASIDSYAQYSDSLKVVHMPKRKRSAYEVHFLPYNKVVVYKGWLQVKKEYTNISKYRAFDKQFLIDIIKELGQPFAQY